MPTTPRKTTQSGSSGSGDVKRSRKTRTLAERAQDALGVAERAVTKHDADVKRLTEELATATSLRDLAVSRRDFLAGDPALKPVETLKVVEPTPAPDPS